MSKLANAMELKGLIGRMAWCIPPDWLEWPLQECGMSEF